MDLSMVPRTAFIIPYASPYGGTKLLSIQSRISFNRKYVAVKTDADIMIQT